VDGGTQRGGFFGQVTGLCVTGLVLSPAVPNATARTTLVAPAVGELVEALGYSPRSRPAAGLAMAALVGCGQMVTPFLTSSTTAVLIFALLPQVEGIELDFVSWALYAAPPNAIMFLGMVGALLWFYRPRGEADAATALRRETLQLQRKLIGPPTRAERLSLLLGVALLVGFATQPLHGVGPAWVAALGLGAFGVMRLVDNSMLSSVNWSFVLLFGILSSLANVFEATGVDRWLGSSVSGLLGLLAGERVLFVAALTCLLMRRASCCAGRPTRRY
jgi:di/tricarboxylate transporter